MAPLCAAAPAEASLAQRKAPCGKAGVDRPAGARYRGAPMSGDLPHIYTPVEKRLALAAVMIVLFLGALDQTIVATAMPRIVADMRGLDRIAWVGTAYLLTSTVVVPIYGKLGDIFGRRPVLVFGVLTFLFGSMLCGLAGEFGALPLLGDGMNQLIACRALQGLGAGALTTGAFATIADIAPPAERGRYTGFFGAMFGLAGLAGPLLGGLLTDHATLNVAGHVIAGWRFIFYVNLPLGLVALYVLLTKLPPGRRGADSRIDWLGSALIVAAAVPLLLALSWGGQGQGWGQPRIAIALAVALVAFIAFLRAARGKPHAVVPLDLFADKVVARAALALFLINLGYIGVPMFLPLYLQLVKGLSASASGFATLPLLFGVLTGSMTAGQVARRTQQYKPVLIAGGAVSLVALVLLTQLTPAQPRWLLSLNLLLLGLGLGPAQGMFSLAIQSAVSHSRVGVATAAGQFCRQIGSTIGVALFGALLTFQLTSELPARVPQLVDGGARFELSHAQTLAMHRDALAAALALRGVTGAAAIDSAGEGLRTSFALAIERLFPVALFILGIGFVVTLAVPARRLRGRGEVPAAAREAAEGTAAAIA